MDTEKIVEVCDNILGNCEQDAPAGYPEEGIYFIYHDGLRDEISGKKSKILAEGSNEEVSFQEEFLIGDNGCHVFKTAGPDTVFVELN